ncbi:MAG: amidohydrolase family protein [Thermoprotei archaeon]|nr:amidohydrolase family protein [Thermoprotei archaeon]
MSLLDRIKDEVYEIRTIDTHEHIYPYEVMIRKGVDLFEILRGSYVSWITEIPEGKSYSELADNLKRVRGSAFLRSYIRAVKELYGVDISQFDEGVLKEASVKISRAYEDRRWYRIVLRDRAGIDRCILDPYWDPWIENYDQECFSLAFRINMFLFGYNRAARDHNGNSPYDLAQRLGFDIESFEDYLDFIDHVFKKIKDRGYVCLKSALAYDREIYFEEVNEGEAKRIFGKDEKEITQKERKKFGDFIMHYLLSKAEEYSLPIQFHTGLARIEDSNPMNLVGLFRKYPGVTFILFHGGYPWISETAALALSFPNVHVDLCWLPLISPSAAERLLRELIETGSESKIMWGGDCWVVEGAYGALFMAKDTITSVLADYVEDGYLSFDDALDIARKILNENARRIFHL